MGKVFRHPITIAILAALLLALGFAAGWTAESTFLRVFFFVFGPAAAILIVWFHLRESRIRLLPATLASFGCLWTLSAPVFWMPFAVAYRKWNDGSGIAVAIDSGLTELISRYQAPTEADQFRVMVGFAFVAASILMIFVQRRRQTVSGVPQEERDSKKPVGKVRDRDLEDS